MRVFWDFYLTIYIHNLEYKFRYFHLFLLVSMGIDVQKTEVKLNRFMYLIWIKFCNLDFKINLLRWYRDKTNSTFIYSQSHSYIILFVDVKLSTNILYIDIYISMIV